jgi:hypothetical protein
VIASFHHGFVFIKTRKTGGTSVEIVLSAWCGPDDIVTPIAPEDEVVRARYGGAPRNYLHDPRLETEYVDAIRSGDLDTIRRVHQGIRRRQSLPLALRAVDVNAVAGHLLRKARGRLAFRNHTKAAAARRALPQGFWERALTFCVDRHPYEKAVSMTYWRRGADAALAREPFEATLERIVESGRYANHPFYMKDGQLLVDEVYRHEEMWAQIAKLGRRIGRTLPDPLPHAKGAQRADRRPAREILSPAQRGRIQEVCAAEFELLGYEP